MSEKCIDDLVRDVLKTGIDADDDGKISYTEAARFAGACIEAGLHVLSDLRDRSKFDELATACEKMFDEYVVPYDIKVVPDFIEGAAEQVIKAQIRPQLANLYDYLDKVS